MFWAKRLSQKSLAIPADLWYNTPYKRQQLLTKTHTKMNTKIPSQEELIKAIEYLMMDGFIVGPHQFLSEEAMIDLLAEVVVNPHKLDLIDEFICIEDDMHVEISSKAIMKVVIGFIKKGNLLELCDAGGFGDFIDWVINHPMCNFHKSDTKW